MYAARLTSNLPAGVPTGGAADRAQQSVGVAYLAAGQLAGVGGGQSALGQSLQDAATSAFSTD